MLKIYYYNFIFFVCISQLLFTNSVIAQNTIHQDLGVFYYNTLGQDTGFTSSRSLFNPLSRDSLFLTYSQDSLYKDYKYAKYTNYLLHNNWIAYQESPNKYITLDPYYDIQFGREFSPENRSIYKYRRGVLAQGQIGKRLKFFSVLSENVAKYDSYTQDFIYATRVSPGEGFAKIRDDGAVNIWQSVGALELMVTKEFKFTFGHGKNFIGDGHRSLLLSDNANSYPFAKMDFKFWRFKYSAIVGEFIDMYNRPSRDALRQKSYGSFHHLDIKINKWWYLGLVEAVIWKGDSLQRSSFDINYLNPFVIMRPQELNLGSPDNMLIGYTAVVIPTNSWKLYSQLVLTELKTDELFGGNNWWANKYGMQAGTRISKLKKFPGFTLQAEYNFVRPFTYSHKNSAQTYGHFYQPLAHPLGANFQEMLAIFSYRYKRFFTQYKAVYHQVGKDNNELTSVGNDIFRSYELREKEYGNTLLQGDLHTTLIHQFKFSWLLNPANHMFLEGGYNLRTIWNKDNQTNYQHFFIGVRTAFLNYNYDY